MAYPDQRELLERHRDWCLEQREAAARALDMYKRGTVKFTINGANASMEQAASLRRMIENMDSFIERIETHLA